jgi:hypothetical protein
LSCPHARQGRPVPPGRLRRRLRLGLARDRDLRRAGNRTDWTIAGGTRVRAAYDAEGQLCDAEIGSAPATPSCDGGNVGYDEAGRITEFPSLELRDVVPVMSPAEFLERLADR